MPSRLSEEGCLHLLSEWLWQVVNESKTCWFGGDSLPMRKEGWND